jgi:NhaP-type Na+/H+ or K+/H+ antiporter
MYILNLSLPTVFSRVRVTRFIFLLLTGNLTFIISFSMRKTISKIDPVRRD